MGTYVATAEGRKDAAGREITPEIAEVHSLGSFVTEGRTARTSGRVPTFAAPTRVKVPFLPAVPDNPATTGKTRTRACPRRRPSTRR